jgi:predicted nucleic acid-binding protein
MKRFFDTNILLYRYDVSAPRKRHVANELLDAALLDGSFQISTQVMVEFRDAATRKFKQHLHPDDIYRLLLLWESFDVVATTAALVVEASERCRKHQLGWWDSLILTAAVRGGASVLYSEDFQHGRSIDGVRIENPFANSVHEPRAEYRV